jgi:DNA-binding NtrC family response regulator
VLIVDDDLAILESTKAIVESAGYAAQTAETAREAIRKAKSDWFDVALLDIDLPDMQGTELLKRLQEIKPRMIKIMVTGSASLDNAIQCVNLEAKAYIVKPFHPDDLLQVIEEKLKERRAAERLDEDKVTDFIEERLQKLETLHSLEPSDK